MTTRNDLLAYFEKVGEIEKAIAEATDTRRLFELKKEFKQVAAQIDALLKESKTTAREAKEVFAYLQTHL